MDHEYLHDAEIVVGMIINVKSRKVQWKDGTSTAGMMHRFDSCRTSNDHLTRMILLLPFDFLFHNAVNELIIGPLLRISNESIHIAHCVSISLEQAQTSTDTEACEPEEKS
jgi:nitrate reductase gamma subunit